MPSGWHLSEAGQEVPDDMFWNRRLRDGDVVLAEPVSDLSERPTEIHGEPLRLTAAEWAKVPHLGDPLGEAEVGIAHSSTDERDPNAPLLTHDEYLAETHS